MANHLHYDQEGGRSNLTTLIVISIVIIFALGIFATILFSRLINQTISDVLIRPAALSIQRQMRMHLFEQDRFYNWQDPMSVHHFGEFLDEVRTIGDVRRVNIFNKNNILEFSTAKEDIGKTLIDPSVERALQGEIVIEEPSKEDISGIGLSNIIEVYIPANSDKGSVQGVVSVYINEAPLFAFQTQLYLLIALLGISSVATVIIVIYVGFRGQSMVIKKQAKELSTIIEKAPIGIYIVNKKGVIEVFNPKMVEFSGVTSSSEIIGLNVFDLQTYKNAGLDVFLKKGFSGESLETEVEYTSHVSGKKMWRHYYGVPLLDVTGKNVERLLLIVEDATRRKQFEQDLEQKVSVRTKELEGKIQELEKFKEITIGRELKMIELKNLVKEKEGTDPTHI